MKSKSGNVAILFGLALLPLTLMTGIGVDYSLTVAAIQKAQDAADAAALAGTHRLASDESRTSLARAAFDANFGRATDVTRFDFDYVRRGGLGTGTVAFEVSQPLAFGNLFGKSSWTIAGSAQASISTKSYIDVEFWLDQSASMGLAATEAGRDTLRALSRNDPEHANCAFACHIPTRMSDNTYRTSQERAHANDIDLRIDVMKENVDRLVADFRSYDPEFFDFRFRIAGLGRAFTELAAYTGDGEAVQRRVNDFSLIANDWTPSRLSNTLLTGAQSVQPQGRGTGPDDRRRYIVIVTDGMQFDWNSIRNGGVSSATCDALQQRGADVAVIQLRYVRLDGDAAFNQWVSPRAVSTKAESGIHIGGER